MFLKESANPRPDTKISSAWIYFFLLVRHSEIKFDRTHLSFVRLKKA